VRSRLLNVWAAGLAAILSVHAPQAGAIAIYDTTTGSGAIGSNLAATANWSISGTGGGNAFAGNIGGINDGGILAYQLGIAMAFGAGSRKRRSRTHSTDSCLETSAITSAITPAMTLAITPAITLIGRGPQRRTMKMAYRMVAVLVATCPLCCSTALAVSDFVLGTYDADVGNPANAAEIQSPEEQGFSEWASTAQNQDPTIATQEGVIDNDGTNAWLNSDLAGTNPGYLIDITTAQIQAAFDFGWRSEIVITMTEGGHFTSFGVGDGNPWGLPVNSRVGFAPSTNGDTITIDPVDNGDGANIVTPAGTVGDFYRVVVSGDVRSTSGHVEVFDFSDGTQVGATQNFSSWSGGDVFSTNRFSLQSGSSDGTGRVSQIHSMNLAVPAPDTLTLEVNKTTGATRLVNRSDVPIDFNGYFIESDGGQLSAGGWDSLESIDLDGNGTPDDGIGWEAFDAIDASFLAEGFLTGSTTLDPGGALRLGRAYNPAIAGVNNDGDLSFKLTDAAGRTIPSSLFSTIRYVTINGIPEDLNGDGFVDGLDLGILLGNFNQNGIPESGGNLNGTNPVDGLDLGILLGTWNPPGGLSAVSVPEPGSDLLMLVGGLLAATRIRRRKVEPTTTSIERWHLVCEKRIGLLIFESLGVYLKPTKLLAVANLPSWSTTG